MIVRHDTTAGYFSAGLENLNENAPDSGLYSILGKLSEMTPIEIDTLPKTICHILSFFAVPIKYWQAPKVASYSLKFPYLSESGDGVVDKRPDCGAGESRIDCDSFPFRS